ncbi:MAG: 50S ribosomal protein L9 [Deltaproteobacteria bacterium]|nr:50S ribosomal protein L9 [Deltaproteobacteria bacterium]
MQVILQEDVPHVGKAGDVVKVKPGYGRNFLLPQKKAVVADPKNLKMLEHHQRVVAAGDKKRRVEFEALAKKLSALTVTFEREVGGDEGKLFGAVTVKDIVEGLRKAGFTVDRHVVKLAEPIKQLGEFPLEIKLYRDVTATVNICVTERKKT